MTKLVDIKNESAAQPPKKLISDIKVPLLIKTHSIRQDILDTALRNSQKQTEVAPNKKDSSSLPQPVLKETNKLTPVGNGAIEDVMMN